MGTVIVHAGMPKTGSSSIQAWLAEHASWLRDRGTEILVATDRDHHEVRMVPYRSGGVVSGQLVYGYLAWGRHEPILRRLVDEIDALAHRSPTTVITAEGLTNLLTPRDENFTAALERLAQHHRVRVAYYVRPQHTSMEAAWCQWGYRVDDPPSTYLEQWAATLEYRTTLQQARAAMPSVELEVRPFRSDLLVDGDIVADFVTSFLGLARADLPTVSSHVNRGFPLDVVNLLRAMPRDVLWRSEDDNRYLDRLRPLVDELDVEPTVAATRSRQILHRYCHERFEPDNRALIAELGWETDAFVPEPEASASDERDLAILDELWAEPSPGVAQALLATVRRRRAELAGAPVDDECVALDRLDEFLSSRPG